MYDTFTGKQLVTVHTPHTNNIFAVKELPGSQRNHLVSCAADGRVVEHILDRGYNKVLYEHRGRAHRLSLVPDGSPCFMSCGEDGKVCTFDLRESHAPISTQQVLDKRQRRMAIYSIAINPLRPYQFSTGGDSQIAFQFDRRLGTDAVGFHCPGPLLQRDSHITCLKYRCTGDSLIASYSDDGIYSFDAMAHLRPVAGDAGDVEGFLTRFSGHRNVQTVKQLNYMGWRDEYVVSGSDCGHIFVWDSRGRVVTVLKGDSIGAVNCLSPHPSQPLLATSGLESSGKLWGVGDGAVSQQEIERVVRVNEEISSRANVLHGPAQMLLRMFGLDDTPQNYAMMMQTILNVGEDEEKSMEEEEEDEEEDEEDEEEEEGEDDDDDEWEDVDDEELGVD